MVFPPSVLEYCPDVGRQKQRIESFPNLGTWSSRAVARAVTYYFQEGPFVLLYSWNGEFSPALLGVGHNSSWIKMSASFLPTKANLLAHVSKPLSIEVIP